LSPFSPHYPGVSEVCETLLPVPAGYDPYEPTEQQRLRGTLDGLTLTVLAQDRYEPLWRGIETQLKRVGVTLRIEFTTSEKDIFGPLLQTNAGRNEKKWDLLVWGNDDWYFNHPFTAFFVFRTNNVWSTIFPDPTMDGYIEDMFRTPVIDADIEDMFRTPMIGADGKESFTSVCEDIMRRAYEESYMLFVPTPKKVFAVNKEVVFRPYKMACIPLWKIQIADQHWSLRKGPYAEALKRPVKPFRTVDQ
jgi:peptide/nickel transport system substrate-binding protein